MLFLRRFVEYLKTRAATNSVVSQSCVSFLADIAAGVNVDAKTLRFCYDRLSSLMKTLELHNTDDYWPIQVQPSLPPFLRRWYTIRARAALRLWFEQPLCWVSTAP